MSDDIRAPVVALTGYLRSGKTTAAKMICELYGFERQHFADPLKRMLRELGLTEEEINGRLKEKPCSLLGGKTPRYAMQTLGTEWGRKTIYENLWTAAWAQAWSRNRRAVVLDDCRFPNEAYMARSAGGVIIRINRPEAEPRPQTRRAKLLDMVGSRRWLHPSERYVELIKPDLEIDNDATVETLRRRIEKAMARLNFNLDWSKGR